MDENGVKRGNPYLSVKSEQPQCVDRNLIGISSVQFEEFIKQNHHARGVR